MGNMIFRQIINWFFIGVNSEPFIAYLTLNTFWLINDINASNSDSVFQEHVGNIYPDSLILNPYSPMGL